MTPDEQQTFDTLTVERDNAREDAKKHLQHVGRLVVQSNNRDYREAAMLKRISTYKFVACMFAVVIAGWTLNVVVAYGAYRVAASVLSATILIAALMCLVLDNNYDK